MRKFIIGYTFNKNTDEGELVEYPDKKTADMDAEDWVEFEAKDWEDAKARYDEEFNKWREKQDEQTGKM